MAVFAKSGVPSPTSVPPMETDRINTQRAAAAIAAGDMCQLGAGGWSPTATFAPGLRMAAQSAAAGESVTLWNPRMRVRYGAPTGGATVPGTLLYLDAGAAGGLNTTALGAAVARALANSRGVFEGVIELL